MAHRLESFPRALIFQDMASQVYIPHLANIFDQKMNLWKQFGKNQNFHYYASAGLRFRIWISDKAKKSRTHMSITLRLERPEDYRGTEVLTREAFWNVYKPGCDEGSTEEPVKHLPSTNADAVE